MWTLTLREAKPEGCQSLGFPLVSGKVRILSPTLSGLFLTGAVNRPKKRKGQVGKIPKIGKVSNKNRESPKKDKKEGQVHIREPPRLSPPPTLGLGGKQGQFVILRFPLCCSAGGGANVPRYWERQHEECHCHVPFCAPQMGNIPVTTTTPIFPRALRYKWEAYCNTNGRRTAIQMGGVLKYFPFLRAQWHQEHYNTNWRRIAIQREVYCVRYFFERLQTAADPPPPPPQPLENS